MTTDEYADKVMHDTKHAGHRYVDEGGMREAIRDAIRAAVMAEREACAKEADDYEKQASSWGNACGLPECIAEAIRERGR